MRDDNVKTQQMEEIPLEAKVSYADWVETQQPISEKVVAGAHSKPRGLTHDKGESEEGSVRDRSMAQSVQSMIEPATTSVKGERVHRIPNEYAPLEVDAVAGSVSNGDVMGEKKVMSYEEMFKQLNPYKPPTPEEVAREKKKQKREELFTSIGDGISALSNLYFTTRYAPNMYAPNSSASEYLQRHYDKLRAERDANMNAYINGVMQAKRADKAEANGERSWNYQLAKQAEETRRWENNQQRLKDKDRADDERQNKKVEADIQLGKDKLVETVRHNGEVENQGKQRVAAAQTSARAAMINAGNNTRRTNAYVTNVNASLNGRGGKKDMVAVNYGEGDTVYVHSNVYKNNKGALLNSMVDNAIGMNERETYAHYKKRIGDMTKEQQDAFIATHVGDAKVRPTVERLSRVAPKGGATPPKKVEPRQSRSRDEVVSQARAKKKRII